MYCVELWVGNLAKDWNEMLNDVLCGVVGTKFGSGLERDVKRCIMWSCGYEIWLRTGTRC